MSNVVRTLVIIVEAQFVVGGHEFCVTKILCKLTELGQQNGEICGEASSHRVVEEFKNRDEFSLELICVVSDYHCLLLLCGFVFSCFDFCQFFLFGFDSYDIN